MSIPLSTARFPASLGADNQSPKEQKWGSGHSFHDGSARCWPLFLSKDGEIYISNLCMRLCAQTVSCQHNPIVTMSQSHRPQTSTTIMPHAQKQLQTLELSKRTQQLVELEHKYTVGGFRPMPAFFVEGKGAKLWVRLTVNPYSITIDQMKLKLLTPESLRMLMGKNTLISLQCFRP